MKTRLLIAILMALLLLVASGCCNLTNNEKIKELKEKIGKTVKDTKQETDKETVEDKEKTENEESNKDKDERVSPDLLQKAFNASEEWDAIEEASEKGDIAKLKAYATKYGFSNQLELVAYIGLAINLGVALMETPQFAPILEEEQGPEVVKVLTAPKNVERLKKHAAKKAG